MRPVVRKNPHGVIVAAWFALTALGIGSFVLAKRDIESKRLEQMQIRERMKSSNEGDYTMTRKF